MTELPFETAEKSISGPGPELWTQWLVRNLILYFGLLILGVANFTFHAHYPLVIAWLPSGLAVAGVLLYGPRVLPGVILAMASILLVTLGNPTTAIIFGLANGAACAVAWGLSRLGKWSNFQRQTVSNMTRMLLIGCVPFALMALMLGPYTISSLIQHDYAEMKTSSNVAPLSEHGNANHEASGRVGQAPNVAEPETPAIRNEHAAISPQPTHGERHSNRSSEGDMLEKALIDAIGVLLLAPAIFYFKATHRNPARAMAEDYRGALCTLAVLIGVTLSIYSGYLEQNFEIVHTTLLVLPPAVWLALKHDLGYTLIGNVVVLFIVGIGTSLGHGPFNDHSSGLPLLTLIFTLTTLVVAASRSERKAAEETIHRLATQDTLTGIPNRTTFNGRMEQALYSARRYQRNVAVMFIDLDHFKKVNDTLGHQAGDLLLVEVASRIQACMRSDSILARFGGDEFVILLDHVTDKSALAAVADRIAKSVSAPFDIMGHACHVACSIGISIFPDDGESASELMRKADMAMYEVKACGRNAYRFYSPQMQSADDPHRRGQ